MKTVVSTILRQAQVSRPAIAALSGLAAPLALAATGDLDPSFGEVGRISPLSDLSESPIWSIEAREDGFVLGGGGDNCGYYCSYYNYYSYYYYTTGFAGLMDADGGAESVSEDLSDIQVLDVAVQEEDGKTIGVGRSMVGGLSRLAVFRLDEDGVLDSSFGDEGVVRFRPLDQPFAGSSVALDPDTGGVVVAGTTLNNTAIVVRLLDDGSVDPDFGSSDITSDGSGVFTIGATSGRPRIVRTADGNYRVSVVDGTCTVVGVTALGELDEAFADGGFAVVDPALNTCSSMVALPDDELLLAGEGDDGVIAVRLLASGETDQDFATDGASTTPIAQVTALGVDPAGSVVLAGRAEEGNAAVIVRLQADGQLDTAFGTDGTTLIDLPSNDAEEEGLPPVGAPFFVNDMSFDDDGAVTVVGGDNDNQTGPAVARLFGDSGGDSPGVLGVLTDVFTDEATGEAVITVRRTGGRKGAVSVDVETRPTFDPEVGADLFNATEPDDYTTVTQTLTWPDGDVTDKEIRVPIAPDGSDPEEAETFAVTVFDATGGAGLGTQTATVEIAADGSENGSFSIEGPEGAESPAFEDNTVEVVVKRNYSTAGEVSVTVTPVPGTASDADFEGEPIVLTWGDEDDSEQIVQFEIVDDDDTEGAESFSVELSSPTCVADDPCEAIIGPRAAATITIRPSDQPPAPPTPTSGGGGGVVGWLSLLLLAAARLMRRSNWSGARATGGLRHIAGLRFSRGR
jgi:uncharacterized delta-60 repeat protein